MNKVGFERDTPAFEDARRSPTAASWTRFPRTVRYAVLLGTILALWQLYVTLVDPATVPGPPEVGRAFVELWTSYGYLATVWNTLGALAVGMFIGLALAALLAGFATRTGEDLLTLLARIFDTVPAIAVLPLLVLWLGTSSAALVLIAVYSVTWPVATSLRSGLKEVDPTIVMVGQSLGLRGWGMIRDVMLPAALPYAISGTRTGWASCWRSVVAAGLVFGVMGAPGFFTDEAGGLLDAPELFAGILNLVAIGILVEAAFGLLERRTIIRWGTKARA